MVSKEADSVVGPYLSQRANKAGVVATPVDGDQPSLLIGLLCWARLLGLNVVAAGKSSEYDFVYDRGFMERYLGGERRLPCRTLPMFGSCPNGE